MSEADKRVAAARVRELLNMARNIVSVASAQIEQSGIEVKLDLETMHDDLRQTCSELARLAGI